MVSVPARRQQVAYAREHGVSARRACTLLSVARSALHYGSRKAAKDAPVIARMQELSAQYPRYGYGRIRIFLDRDGHVMSPGRVHRLWRTARLQVPRKPNPNPEWQPYAAGIRTPHPQKPTASNRPAATMTSPGICLARCQRLDSHCLRAHCTISKSISTAAVRSGLSPPLVIDQVGSRAGLGTG